MKRLLSILLTLGLLLCAAGATAETVTTTLMELETGVNIVLEHESNVQLYPSATSEPGITYWYIDDAEHAPVNLCIARSEIDSALSLADLTEEQQMQYGKQVGEMFANPEIHLDTTPSGNLYIHISSNEESDIDTLFTIYKGYFVELVQYSGTDFAQLTEADEAFCLSLLHGIEFVTAE